MTNITNEKINSIIINTDKKTICVIPDKDGEHYISTESIFTETIRDGILTERKFCEIGVDYKDILIIINE